MNKHFYHSLVETDSIQIALENLDITKEEKQHLLAIFHSSVHTVIIDVVLTEIPTTDKKMFLEVLEKGAHDTIWDFLHKRSFALEEKIKKRVKDIKKEFHADILALKKK